MPRIARPVLPGLPLHVVQRGINRQKCFFADSDYVAYLGYLGSLAPRFGCALHAYCLMTNHVHLLLTPIAQNSCALLMKNLSQRYVQAVNKRLERSGTLWAGRFKSCLVHSEAYLLACYRYIELNPVRAGIVDAPGQYRWSSYLANAEGKANGLLASHPAYDALGLSGPQRTDAYRKLFGDALPEVIVDEIRKATRIGCAVGIRRRGRGRPWQSQVRKMGSVPI
jgi:putative transposase